MISISVRALDSTASATDSAPRQSTREPPEALSRETPGVTISISSEARFVADAAIPVEEINRAQEIENERHRRQEESDSPERLRGYGAALERHRCPPRRGPEQPLFIPPASCPEDLLFNAETVRARARRSGEPMVEAQANQAIAAARMEIARQRSLPPELVTTEPPEDSFPPEPQLTIESSRPEPVIDGSQELRTAQAMFILR